MRHTIFLALSLAIFWLLNSGHNTVLMLSLGAVSIALVLYIAHRMDVVDHESQPLHITLLLPGYYAWLIKEIILANSGGCKTYLAWQQDYFPYTKDD